MGEQVLKLPWGKEEMTLALPEAWRVTGVLQPVSLPGVSDAAAEVRRSLAEPVGALPLRETAVGAQRVALVVDDSSRPTPVGLIMPAVLDELRLAGVEMQNVTVVPAVGLHRPMTEEELAARIGGAVAGLQWENPECDDPARLVNLGTTSRGTPVWMNKIVAEADLVISIGCIEPHIIASFGGGYKNLIPGVAGRASVAHNHSLNCMPYTFNMVGQPILRNPMRLDLEEAARLLTPPVFIVNAVLNSTLEIVKVVAGDPILAHRAGVKTSAAIYGVAAPAEADVVITNSRPMDQDLRQGVKALANTIRAVKPGGVLITLVRADEGVGVFGLANRKLPLGRGALQLLAPLLVRLVPRLKLKGMGEEDRFFLYFALQAMQRATLLMYAPTIPAAVQANLPFVRFVASPEDALAFARRRFPRKADVLVFPNGGSTYPILT
ncbi:MAG: nickel-dependent lactate racemase [Chloroflexi bacterium]|nr:nickel-dependent lactate racemase [Chloroflexota bacterium]